MVGKIKAALDARTSRETLIIARTDAVAVEGFDRAVARVLLYCEAGADMLFVEAPRQRDELARIAKQVGGKVPLMANMVEGGKTPILPAPELRSSAFHWSFSLAGSCARSPRRRRIFTHSLEGAWHDRSVPSAHVRFRCAQRCNWDARN